MRTIKATLILLTVSLLACSEDNRPGTDRVFSGSTSNSAGCQGADLDRTRRLIEASYFVGIEIANEIVSGGDFINLMNKTIAVSQELDAAARSLPPACQLLVQQWSNSIAAAQGSSSGTQCMGGVCCDGTGCY